MHRYIIKRLLMLIPVLLSVAFIIFAIMDVAEGDPVYSVVSADASEEEIQAAREEMGLTGSLFERYFNYVKGMLHGDLGTSYVSKRDVMETYLTRLPNTLKLASVTMIVALGISIPLGIVAAVNQNSIKDTVSMILALLGQKLRPFAAACVGSYLLGASAETAFGLLQERMLMARDVIGAVEETLESLWKPAPYDGTKQNEEN